MIFAIEIEYKIFIVKMQLGLISISYMFSFYIKTELKYYLLVLKEYFFNHFVLYIFKEGGDIGLFITLVRKVIY